MIDTCAHQITEHRGLVFNIVHFLKFKPRHSTIPPVPKTHWKQAEIVVAARKNTDHLPNVHLSVDAPDDVDRRRVLALATAAAVVPLFGSFHSAPARAAAPRDLHFHALHRSSPVGRHIVAFRADGERLTVTTRIEITIKVLFVTAFSFKHDAEEVWQSGRLVSVKSATEDQGTLVQVSGYAAGDGFRIIGADGPSLAAAHLLTSNTLWDSRLVRESRVIDVQYGSEVGLVAKQLGDEQVETPQGRVRATRHQVITPHYAGSLFYDAEGRWIKGLIEQQGEVVEYVLAT